MPAEKSTIKISIEVNGERLSVNLSPYIFGKYRVKVGRSYSDKVPVSTLTEVFNLCRKWVVHKSK
jgi:hypothetical protein